MDRKPMTKAARKRHLQTSGSDVCPYCKASIADMCDAIDYGPPEPVEDGHLEQKAHCLTCGRKWIDIFRLVDIQEIA